MSYIWKWYHLSPLLCLKCLSLGGLKLAQSCCFVVIFG